MNRNVCIPAAYLIIKRKNEIILLKRKNTGYEDGNYSFIAGDVEKGESFKGCIIREAKEEAGIKICESDLHLVHIMYRKKKNNDKHERIDSFYEADKWKGNISNLEPEKCSELKWFNKDNIPENTIPFIKKVLEQIEKKVFFTEFGWQKNEI